MVYFGFMRIEFEDDLVIGLFIGVFIFKFIDEYSFWKVDWFYEIFGGEVSWLNCMKFVLVCEDVFRSVVEIVNCIVDYDVMSVRFMIFFNGYVF